MWDSGGESAAGTREILEPFDDALEKLRFWFHEGAPLFRITPDDPIACARWISLFGIDPQEWPRSLWYRLASLVASLPTLSCSQSGFAFVLDVLLDLPIKSLSWHRTFVALPHSAVSALGARSSLLGVDTIVGDAIEDLASLEIEIGPVSLAIYQQFTADAAGAELLQRTLHMIMPLSTSFDLRWSVLDQTQAPRLGIPEQNARLGINTHMGLALPHSAWSEA
jgi:predicted component of type VI protein secretion system